MEPKRTIAEILAFYKNHFRIISDWSITLEAHPKGKYTDRVNWNNRTKIANIFPLTKDYDFENYIFHEILHVCQAELNRGSIKEKREKEEIFVVDLCRLHASQSKEVTLPSDGIQKAIDDFVESRLYIKEFKEWFIEKEMDHNSSYTEFYSDTDNGYIALTIERVYKFWLANNKKIKSQIK